jgi:hypothetical protein
MKTTSMRLLAESSVTMKLAAPAGEGQFLLTSNKRCRDGVEMIRAIGLRRIRTGPRRGVTRLESSLTTAQLVLATRMEYFLADVQDFICPKPEQQKHAEFEFPFPHALSLSSLPQKYAEKQFIWLPRRLTKR